jgi:hypothetical protein
LFIDTASAEIYLGAMLRRLATLLLALCVTFAGLLAKPHAAACCVVRQAAAHDCCKRGDQLQTSSCCRGDKELGARVVDSQHAPQQSVPVSSLTDDITPQVSLVTIGVVALTRGLAPPGTLIAQHTSLLV